MTERPIRDYLGNLDNLPKQEFQVGIVADEKDQGAVVEGSVDFGKPGGWSTTIQAQWMRVKGASGAWFLKWKGK
jgi:hypothetical protein